MSENKKKPVSSTYNQGDPFVEVTYSDASKERIPIRTTSLGASVMDDKKKKGDNDKHTS